MTSSGITFEAYSYRTSARFGSRVQVSVDDGMVAVTGPRVGVALYRLWIAGQVILFWLIVPALVGAVVLWDWRYVGLALVLMVAHWALGTFGAVSFWELANLNAFMEGTTGQMATFSVRTVKRVRVGRGWARKGLWLVIPYVVPGINQVAQGYCVSFEAPDGETGKDAVYALHMQTQEDAQALARLVENKENSGAGSSFSGQGSWDQA